MEFGFGGPHMVFYGPQDVREGFEFAAAQLAAGAAQDVLVTAYESAEPNVLPDGTPVMHGAVALHLQAEAEDVLLTLDVSALRARPRPDDSRGMTAAILELLTAAGA